MARSAGTHGPAGGDLLDRQRQAIQERLAALAPLVEEYHRLSAAAAALSGAAAPHTPGPRRRSAGSRSPTTRPPKPKERPPRSGPGRPRGSGTADRAVRHLRRQPGLTIPQLAAKMRMRSNYLYRLLPELEKQGRVSRDGPHWSPPHEQPTRHRH